jgi:hypothetical protein
MSRPGIDGWLEQAELVLQEQRDRSLSPSSDPAWGDDRLEQTMTLTRFAADLEDVLRSLCERPGRWILIAEDAAHHHHFWQALCFEDGSLHVEVVSNYYLEGDDRLTGELEGVLRAGGWMDPKPPRSPNWTRTETTTSPDVGEVAQQTVRALREVFGLGEADKIFVKLFSSPLRGHTPASPTYEEAGEPDDVESQLIDPFGGPDGEDPDIFGPDPEVGQDELNGPWETTYEEVRDGGGLGRSWPGTANPHLCDYEFSSIPDHPSRDGPGNQALA